jgi:hypothetical protein
MLIEAQPVVFSMIFVLFFVLRAGKMYPQIPLLRYRSGLGCRVLLALVFSFMLVGATGWALWPCAYGPLRHAACTDIILIWSSLYLNHLLFVGLAKDTMIPLGPGR